MTATTELPLLLTAKRARTMLGLGEHKFRQYVKDGTIPAECVFNDPDTRYTYYRRDPLIAWAADRERAA